MSCSAWETTVGFGASDATRHGLLRSVVPPLKVVPDRSEVAAEDLSRGERWRAPRWVSRRAPGSPTPPVGGSEVDVHARTS